jgi:hypothetical protein
VDDVIDDRSRREGWRFWRWLSGRKNIVMRGGNNGINEGVNVVVRNGRTNSMDVAGSTGIAGSE